MKQYNRAQELILMNEVDGQYNYPSGMPEDFENADMLDVGTFETLLTNYAYAKDSEGRKIALHWIKTYIRDQYRTDEMNKIGVCW